MRKVAVYAGTRNLYKAMQTVVHSLLANNKMDKVYLLIEDDSFPYPMPGNVETVNVLHQTYFPVNGANFTARWSYMAMMRCALAKVLPDEKRVLWLDCDTIVDADISEVFNLCMERTLFAGVKEEAKSRNGFTYLNSGVLLMNLDYIREIKHDDRMINLLNTHPMELPDQDTINMLSQGYIYDMDSKYNACPFTKECPNPKIYHFAGRPVFDNDPVYKKYAQDERPVRTLIAVPCFDMVHTDFVDSFLALDRPEGTVHTFIKNTLIYNARNAIAQNAIKHGFDRVLWVDSDMILPPDALVTLANDLDAGYEYVSGLYFMRATPTLPVIYSDVLWRVKEDGWVETGRTHYQDYPKGLFEIAGSGFGCVMTSVDLLKRLVDKYGAPFTPLMGMGEDLAFCWRVSQIGAKMYCDSRVKCGHIGQKVFTEVDYITAQMMRHD